MGDWDGDWDWLASYGFPVAAYYVALAAVAVDAAVGDPPWLYRRIAHPVVLLGHLIAALERHLNDGSAARRMLTGLATVLTVIAIAAACAVAVMTLVVAPLDSVAGIGWLAEAAVASTLLAGRGLYEHVRAVAQGLGISLDAGRQAVSHIVGRDPRSLDRAGVARAALESLAENFSDGVVAPLFWFLVAGLPGLAAYKAVNTLDSMIGHRTERYRCFGKVAARLDDAANFVPARLAGLLIVLAAVPLPGARAGRAFAVMWRYAPRHRSPNAGWQEAALAGALDFALAGPRRYRDEVVDDAWMGEGRRDLDAADVRASLHLYLAAGALIAAGLAVATLAPA